jgi:hypothetical protein
MADFLYGACAERYQNKSGQSGGDRTPDPQLRRLLLYPTELRTDQKTSEKPTRCAIQNAPQTGSCEALDANGLCEATKHLKLGRSTRIRTLDPLVPNQVRYQTAPHSEA